MNTARMSKLEKCNRLIFHHADFDFDSWPVVSSDAPIEEQRKGIESIINEIDSWHMKRWPTGFGYHFAIGNGHGIPDGVVALGRPMAYQGAQCKHHNHDSVGILVIGDLEDKDPTEAQIDACSRWASMLCFMFGLNPLGEYSKIRYGKRQKGMVISGHGDWPEHSTNKCPGQLSKYLPRIRKDASELLFSHIAGMRYTPR